MNSLKRTLTIKDIAKSLDLSSATISNALNNKGRISRATKEIVLKKAKEIGYAQNMIGKALIEGKTDMIGVFVPEISNEYYSQVITGIEEVLNEKKYSIILIKTGYKADKEIKEATKLKRLLISGLIFLGGNGHIPIDAFEGKKNIPILFIDRAAENSKTASVVTDNLSSMKDAVFYLKVMGHKKIGYFANYPDDSYKIIKERMDGFLSAAKRLQINTEYVFNQKDLTIDPDSIYAYVKPIISNMAKEDMPTAFLCQNDIFAIILIKVLKESGLNVPEDISVMGFDNISLSKYCLPGLTTIKQPKRQMGRLGARLLLQIINQEDIKDQNIVLNNVIIERDSVRKI